MAELRPDQGARQFPNDFCSIPIITCTCGQEGRVIGLLPVHGRQVNASQHRGDPTTGRGKLRRPACSCIQSARNAEAAGLQPLKRCALKSKALRNTLKEPKQPIGGRKADHPNQGQ